MEEQSCVIRLSEHSRMTIRYFARVSGKFSCKREAIVISCSTEEGGCMCAYSGLLDTKRPHEVTTVSL
jgi:hypothetical protein